YLGKDFAKVRGAEVSEVEDGALLSRLRSAVRVVSISIVDRALVGIGQDLECFRDLFKKLFGLLVAGVDVGMVPPRKPAICLAYVFRLRITSHTKRFIVISLAHSGCEMAGDRSPASYA